MLQNWLLKVKRAYFGRNEDASLVIEQSLFLRKGVDIKLAVRPVHRSQLDDRLRHLLAAQRPSTRAEPLNGGSESENQRPLHKLFPVIPISGRVDDLLRLEAGERIRRRPPVRRPTRVHQSRLLTSAVQLLEGKKKVHKTTINTQSFRHDIIHHYTVNDLLVSRASVRARELS